jgi:capsule polysaccharide export protein KpsE/RkpR
MEKKKNTDKNIDDMAKIIAVALIVIMILYYWIFIAE